MPIDPRTIIEDQEPEDLGQLTMPELRALREQLQEVEDGYSYARRVVQGRLDTVLSVLEHKAMGDPDSDLILEMPETLSSHIKGPGLPRPTRALEPPEWAYDLLTDLDTALPLDDLGRLADMDSESLAEIAGKVSQLESELSEYRAALHVRIRRVQGELISRYREGAGVEDLLT